MSKKKVLVVDDSATVRQQVGLALVQAGFEVLEAIDGVDGRAAIEANTTLALVICDVNMPRMDGLEMVEKVKSDPRHGGLPVVMLTTESQPELIKKAKDAGAAGWIIKPFQPAKLIAAAQKLTAA
ncbi:MAG: response regulator [Acidobacteriota bacterium]